MMEEVAWARGMEMRPTRLERKKKVTEIAGGRGSELILETNPPRSKKPTWCRTSDLRLYYPSSTGTQEGSAKVEDAVGAQSNWVYGG
ncbi:hypothetical protein M0R45_005145 [Rubus argutus]|uniref:Uncharacterized protein n=1 Tax=Rubus argutus TaxID=59490 RepID=A0AAW1YLU6_RUBAR